MARNLSPSTGLRKRGRPKGNGSVVFMREMFAVLLYGEARLRDGGMKHSCAVEEAVTRLRELGMKSSARQVRQILARLQPKTCDKILSVSRSSQQENRSGLLKWREIFRRDQKELERYRRIGFLLPPESFWSEKQFALQLSLKPRPYKRSNAAHTPAGT
jgi:hypothetical protein